MKHARNLTLCLFVAFALTLAGCASWRFWSTPPEKVEKKEKEVAASNKTVIADGQAEIAGGIAAAQTLPDGKAKSVTLDFLNRGADLVAQGNGPLDAARALKMRNIALGLLSAEQARREAAEGALAKERGRADETAAENGRLKGQLSDLQGKLAVSWAERDETAKKWERMWFWIWCAAGLYAASIILPVVAGIFSGGAAGPVLGIASKAIGYLVSPAIQFARDRAVGGLEKVGHALEDFRQDAPQMSAKITRTFDSYTDADHQRIVGDAARDYRASLPPASIGRAEKMQQDATTTAA